MTALTTQYKKRPLSDVINLETYTRDSHLIISKPEGDKMMIGRAYEMTPLAGGGQEFSTVVAAMFKTAPDNSVIQITQIGYPDHDAANIFLRGKTHGAAVVQELAKRKAALITGATEIDWNDTSPPLTVKRLVISTLTPISSLKESVLEDALARENEFFSNLKTSGFHDVEIRTPAEIAAIYNQYSNIFQPRQEIVLDSGMELKYQIFGPEDIADFRKQKVGRLGDHTFVSCVTPKTYPGRGISGIMNFVCGAPFNEGTAVEGGGQRIPGPFMITTTVRVANQRSEAQRVENAISSRETVQKFIIKLGNENPIEKLQDLKTLQKQTAEDGNKYVFVSTNVFLFGKTEAQSLNAAAIVKSHMEKLQFDSHIVRDNVFPRWTQNFPLNFSPKVAQKIKGETLMAASAAGTLLPIYSESYGNISRHSASTGVPYFTRRGNLYLFDPFVSDTHYSGVIAAEPGAGKSFMLQDFINSQLAMNHHVYVLDNGRSQKKYAVAVEGEYNEFGTGAGQYAPSLNPMTGLTDTEFEDQKEGITSLLMLMAYENESPEPGAKIALGEATVAAFAQAKGDAEISTVIECLQRIVDASVDNKRPSIVIQAAVNLVPRLKAFIDSPTRGRYFSGKGTIDVSKKFSVFEIAALGDDAHLKKCVLFFVLNSLLGRISKIPGKKVIIMDEAHDLLEDPMVGPAILGIYLKGRKDTVSIWTVVQSMLKLSKTAAGDVVLKQSSWKLIMQQPPEEITEVMKLEMLNSFPGDMYFDKLVKSISSRKGVYSEILIMGRKSYEAVRLYVDKWTATLFSSENEARDVIFQWMKEGMSPVDAVNKLLGDNEAASAKWVRQFINHLRTSYNLTDGQISRTIAKHLNIQ
ncbi:conjugal transfer protein TraC [Pelomonas sp. HMWF004]|nr:conjugal transfer protein TraC [Pelomonas sp. HMWF004]